MATNLDDSVLVKIFFDKEKKRVICAEAGGDFIDTLFSFLTLPMGTVVRLVQRQKFPDSAQIGCVRNLYHSVKGLSAHLFNTDPCKDLLTYPKNSLEPVCKDIKVKVDDTSVRYFLCADMACRKTISFYKNAICSCGKLLNSEAFESKAKEEGNVVKELNPKDTVEVFVKRSTTYLVTDDMKVMCCTLGNLVEVFLERGIKNVNLVEENVLKLGPEEMLNLLGHILISKTPLTDLFLLNNKNISGKEADCHVTSNAQSVNASQNSMEVKIFVSKSNMKPLYVEAMEDFVELLLNFLRFPLSNIVILFTGDSSLGCVDNLYQSVEGLHAKWFVKDGSKLFSKVLLLSPGIAPKFDCSIKDSIFSGVNWREIDRMSISRMGEIRRANIYSDNHSLERGEEILSIANPLALKWGNTSTKFLKESATFTVSDSLVIKPCYNTINISFLKGLHVPIDDIEKHTVKIGKQQVLGILKASLTTNSAFSPLMELLPKKPKQ